MRHNVRGMDDRVLTQWCGRRVDVYFTYDASLERHPKVLLEAPQPPARSRAKP